MTTTTKTTETTVAVTVYEVTLDGIRAFVRAATGAEAIRKFIRAKYPTATVRNFQTYEIEFGGTETLAEMYVSRSTSHDVYATPISILD